jgi:hypothetical protein
MDTRLIPWHATSGPRVSHAPTRSRAWWAIAAAAACSALASRPVSAGPNLGVSVRRILRRLLNPLRPPKQPTDRELLIGQRAELARLNQLRLAAEAQPLLRRSVDVAIDYTHRQIQVIEARLTGRAAPSTHDSKTKANAVNDPRPTPVTIIGIGTP